jgi:hypothetical protein
LYSEGLDRRIRYRAKQIQPIPTSGLILGAFTQFVNIVQSVPRAVASESSSMDD